MKRVWLLALLVSMLAAAALADGPETGVVTGRVLDTGGATLPGVTVTLEGVRGTKTVITGQDGVFRFALVPPGSYALQATLEGFGNADGVASVSAGGKQEVDLRMRLATEETITVTSEAPMVDKYNVTAGATMEGETAGEISASVRSFYGALQVLPGVTNDVESMDLSQSRPTVNGSLWQESNVYVDGVDATYSMRGGGTRVFLPSSALTEVSLEAGGGGAEYGRNVGSHTNLITKSGTNKYHGDLGMVFSRNAWNSNYEPQPALARDQRFVNTFVDQGQTQAEAEQSAANWIVWQPGERDGEDQNIEASIGGPIKRDKAWFFLARGEVSTNQIDKTLDGEIFNVSSELFSTIVKFNFQPGASHSLAATWIDAPVDRIFLLPPMGDRYNATFFDLSGDVTSLTWNYSINSDLFLETKLARQVSDENRRRPFPPEVKFEDPRYRPDPELGPWSPNNNDDSYVQRFDNTWHNGWIFAQGYGLNEFPRNQFNAAMTHFATQNHELKYGLDLQNVEWNQSVQRPDIFSGFDLALGTPFGYSNDCVGDAVDVANEGRDTRCFFVNYNDHGLPLGSGRSDGSNLGAYVRDRWNLGTHWTLTLGLRMEQQNLKNDRDRDVVDHTSFSPRATAVYDVKGDGRRLITASAGRFFVQTPQFLVNSSLQEGWNGASNTYNTYMHVDAIARVRGLDDATACAVLAGLGLPIDLAQTPYCFDFGDVRPGRMWELMDEGLINVDIEPYHRDEIVLGYEHQIGRNWAFDSKAIWWQVDNLIGNNLQRDNNFNLFLLTENYEDWANILRSLNFVENFVEQGIGSAEQAEAILDTFKDDHRRYRGLQLQLNRRFSKGWALYNNITVSKVEGRTYGGGNGNNDLGSFNNLDDDYGRNMEAILTSGILDSLEGVENFCAVNNLSPSCIDELRRFVGQPMSIVNRLGVMPVDRPVIFKSYGYKQFSLGKHSFNLGGLFVWQNGSPYEVTRATANPNVALADLSRNTTINLFMEDRGSRDNVDFWWLNLSGAWNFPLTSNNRFNGQLRLELTNVTNEQSQVATSGRTDAPLRSRRSFQQPRKVRVLAALRF